MICKLLERLIKDHMVDFLVRHKLLNSSHHGFLKARSCLTNMLCFLKKSLTDGDKQHLQNDLDRLVKWSEKWQMFSILRNVNAYIHDMGTWDMGCKL